MRNRARVGVGVLALVLGAGLCAQVAHSAVDQQIAGQLQQKFSKNKDLHNVQPSVNERVVTLTGSVDRYRALLEAEHDARQVSNVRGLINDIHVTGEAVPDDKLRAQLADRLTYDRMGMGQTFNSLNLNVKNGVVTVSGDVLNYPDRDSAIDIIADTAGVRGVVDNINVAPLSPADDALRLQAARRIYSQPDLKRYALDPAHPIRIVVQNGNITLDGVVQSQIDKTLAGNAVRGIPGAFSVKNNLVIAGGKP